MSAHPHHDSLEDLLYLNAADVAGLCAGIDPVKTATEVFIAMNMGSSGVTPESAIYWTAPDGTQARSLMLPAHHAGSYGCKVINACIGNTDRGLDRAHGLVLLHDSATAAVLCIMDAGLVSALRTAAASTAAVAAVRCLDEIQRWAFLGCGRQARTHLELLTQKGRPHQIVVYDLNAARAAAFVEQARHLLPDANVEVAGTAQQATHGAELIIAATTTTRPYVELDWIESGAVFVNVSLDDATEGLLLGADLLLVDDWSLVSADCHRLLGRLARAGRVTAPGTTPPPNGRAVTADLGGVLSGRPLDFGVDARVVINPFGTGAHDVALASKIYQRALETRTGTWLPR